METPEGSVDAPGPSKRTKPKFESQDKCCQTELLAKTMSPGCPGVLYSQRATRLESIRSPQENVAGVCAVANYSDGVEIGFDPVKSNGTYSHQLGRQIRAQTPAGVSPMIVDEFYNYDQRLHAGTQDQEVQMNPKTSPTLSNRPKAISAATEKKKKAAAAAAVSPKPNGASPPASATPTSPSRNQLSLDASDGPSWLDEDCKLQLVIREFSELDETLYSESKIIDGVSWRIMVMPKQQAVHKKSQRCMGFFLQCTPLHAYSDQWSVQAIADMRMLCYKPNTPHFARRTSHAYTVRENDWGYSCFMTWAEVLNEEQGYIKDDTVVLEIAVKAESPKNMISLEQFVKKIDKWIELADMQMKKGNIDLAIEANSNALKFCKGKDESSYQRLEEQRKRFVNAKLFESIERIEKGKSPAAQQDSLLKPTSLRQALTGAQKTLNGKMTAKGGKKARAVVTVQQVKKKKTETNTNGYRETIASKVSSFQSRTAIRPVCTENGSLTWNHGDLTSVNESVGCTVAQSDENAPMRWEAKMSPSSKKKRTTLDIAELINRGDFPEMCEFEDFAYSRPTVVAGGVAAKSATSKAGPAKVAQNKQNGTAAQQANINNNESGTVKDYRSFPLLSDDFVDDDEVDESSRAAEDGSGTDRTNESDDGKDDGDESNLSEDEENDDVYDEGNYADQAIDATSVACMTMDNGAGSSSALPQTSGDAYDLSSDDEESASSFHSNTQAALDSAEPSASNAGGSNDEPTEAMFQGFNADGVLVCDQNTQTTDEVRKTWTSQDLREDYYAMTTYPVTPTDILRKRLSLTVDVEGRVRKYAETCCQPRDEPSRTDDDPAWAGPLTIQNYTMHVDGEGKVVLTPLSMFPPQIMDFEQNLECLYRENLLPGALMGTMPVSLPGLLPGTSQPELGHLQHPEMSAIGSTLMQHVAALDSADLTGQWMSTFLSSIPAAAATTVSKMIADIPAETLDTGGMVVDPNTPFALSADIIVPTIEGVKSSVDDFIKHYFMIDKFFYCYQNPRNPLSRLTMEELEETRLNFERKMAMPLTLLHTEHYSLNSAVVLCESHAKAVSDVCGLFMKAVDELVRGVEQKIMGLDSPNDQGSDEKQADDDLNIDPTSPPASKKDRRTAVAKRTGAKLKATNKELSELNKQRLKEANELKDSEDSFPSMDTAVCASSKQILCQMQLRARFLEQYTMRMHYNLTRARNTLEKLLGEQGILPKVSEMTETIMRLREYVNDAQSSREQLAVLSAKLDKLEPCYQETCKHLNAEYDKSAKQVKEIKDLRSQLKKAEARATKDENRANGLQMQYNELDEKLKQVRKEFDQMKKKAAEERAKSKKEKERDTMLLRQQTTEITDRENERDQLKRENDELVKSRDKSEKERRNATATLTTMANRAKAAEIAVMELRCEKAVAAAKEHKAEALAGLVETEEMAKKARTQGDQEVMAKSVAEWKKAYEKTEATVRSIAQDFEAVIEGIKTGTKTLQQHGDVKVAQPEALPKLLRLPPVQVVAPSSALNAPAAVPAANTSAYNQQQQQFIPQPSAGVIGQPRTPNGQPRTPNFQNERVGDMVGPRQPPSQPQAPRAAARPTSPPTSTKLAASASPWTWNQFCDVLRPESDSPFSATTSMNNTFSNLPAPMQRSNSNIWAGAGSTGLLFVGDNEFLRNQQHPMHGQQNAPIPTSAQQQQQHQHQQQHQQPFRYSEAWSSNNGGGGSSSGLNLTQQQQSQLESTASMLLRSNSQVAAAAAAAHAAATSANGVAADGDFASGFNGILGGINTWRSQSHNGGPPAGYSTFFD